MRLFPILPLLVLLFFTALSPAAAQDDVSWLLDQINCLRQSVGAAPLTMNVALSVAANRQAVNLANDALTEYHVGLDGSTPTIRAREAGFTGSVGENVAAGRQVSDPFNWWINSSVHYSNMTNEHWKEIGIGIASGPHGTWYTLVFGAMSWEVLPAVASPCGTLDAPEPPPSDPVTIDVSSSGTIGNSSNEIANPETVESTEALPTPVILGLDEHGYIQHQIQSGETPGTIMLSYGYAWEDLPTLMALNNMTEADARNLDIGDIFLIPPREGIVTPTTQPAAKNTLTMVSDAANEEDDLILLVVTDTPPASPERIAPSLTPTAALTVMPGVTPTMTQFIAVLNTETLASPAAFFTRVPTLSPTNIIVPPVVFVASLTPTLNATLTPDLTLTAVAVADFATPLPAATLMDASPVLITPETSDDNTSILLTIAIVLQIIILMAMGFAFSVWHRRR